MNPSGWLPGITDAALAHPKEYARGSIGTTEREGYGKVTNTGLGCSGIHHLKLSRCMATGRRFDVNRRCRLLNKHGVGKLFGAISELVNRPKEVVCPIVAIPLDISERRRNQERYWLRECCGQLRDAATDQTHESVG